MSNHSCDFYLDGNRSDTMILADAYHGMTTDTGCRILAFVALVILETLGNSLCYSVVWYVQNGPEVQKTLISQLIVSVYVALIAGNCSAFGMQLLRVILGRPFPNLACEIKVSRVIQRYSAIFGCSLLKVFSFDLTGLRVRFPGGVLIADRGRDHLVPLPLHRPLEVDRRPRPRLRRQVPPGRQPRLRLPRRGRRGFPLGSQRSARRNVRWNQLGTG